MKKMFATFIVFIVSVVSLFALNGEGIGTGNNKISACSAAQLDAVNQCDAYEEKKGTDKSLYPSIDLGDCECGQNEESKEWLCTIRFTCGD